MEREILFRGMDDNKRLIQGYFFQIWEDCFILWGTTNGVPNMTQVDPATVGQFTGLVDKNGTKIFEGDMLTPPDDEIDKAVVEFSNGAFRVSTYGYGIGSMTEHGWDEDIREYELDESEPIEEYGVNNVEVIGNIHDTPDLAKEESE
ncbi:MAG: hypothetical protein EOM62_21865 [Bacteroidia bacterium]|nr:hypothetical protein [Bacteroidia bacterium]